MTFEWYRVAAFAHLSTAELAVKIINQHPNTQSIEAYTRRDTDAYGLYIRPHDAAELIHSILTNNPDLQAALERDRAHIQALQSQSHLNSNAQGEQNGAEETDTAAVFGAANRYRVPAHDSANERVKAKQEQADFIYYQRFFIRNPQVFPVTLLCIALGIIGFIIPAVMWQSRVFFELLFLSFDRMLQNASYWQLLTPTFIHFGWMHILFNGLWLGVLGARIEYSLGWFKTSGVFAVISVTANIVQYLLSAGQPFGGLSGLVYGLLGFLIVQRMLNPTPINAIGKGITLSLLLFLVLGLFGIMDVFIAGSIANGAHVGGLVSGILMAYLMFYRFTKGS